MELLKRKILLEDSIDRNYNSQTYGALTATSFYINVLLTQNIDDMGMFTDMEYVPNQSPNNITDNELRLTGKTIEDYYNYGNKLISGETESRIGEVKTYNNSERYKIGFDINSENYINYSGKSIDGVNRLTYIGDPQTYVFNVDVNDTNIGTTLQKDGLLYKDYSGNGVTVVSYIGQGINETNTSLSAITKEEVLFGIISKPEVKSDVFIDRGITTIFEKHLKLSEITNLGELSRYGRGYFNLIKQ
jgi:hypothetical protein